MRARRQDGIRTGSLGGCLAFDWPLAWEMVMVFEDRPLNTITNVDLQGLVTNAVAELRVVEYKSQLPGGSDKERIEFLRDVSSFANATGGHIFLGIAEKRGIPVPPLGIPIDNVDAS